MIFPIPYKRITFDTALSVDQVTSIMSRSISQRVPMQSFSKPSPNVGTFEGTVTNQKFEIIYIASYGSSFKPIIRGTIHSRNDYTQVDIVMRMYSGTIAVVIYWIGFCFFLLIQTFHYSRNLIESSAIPLVMFLIMYSMMVWSFGREANMAMRFIEKIYRVKLKV